MVHRQIRPGLLVVTQPSHAWISGQLARAWGNEQFGRFEPYEEVCLAAGQHDLGWIGWEMTPTHNPRTGLPYSFLEMPVRQHLEIWSEAARRMTIQSRYAGLLVSLHITWLYEHFPRPDASPDEQRAIQSFLDRERALHQELIAELESDPHYAPVATPDVVARNRRLVGIWDWISLRLCGGLREEEQVARVPTAHGTTTLTLRPLDPEGYQVAVAPWPFRQSVVPLVMEGRRLAGPWANEAVMRAEISVAPRVTRLLKLYPGEST